jgi:GTP-binding protein
VSLTPGRTQQLNFFSLGGALMLVDLPGYGHAAAAKRQIRSWTGLIHAYLRGRPNLRRVVVLVDSRHGLKPTDHALMAELDDVAVSYQIVLTKADKAGDASVKAAFAAVSGAIAKRPAAHPEIAVTSAETGAGIPELRASIAALASETGFR